MHRRTRRRAGLKSSPFVVLTDITIGLAFFFAVFSVVGELANSQAALVLQRQGYQSDARRDVVTAFQHAFPNAKSVPKISPEGDKYMLIEGRSGEVLAEVWENGNFQRVKVFAPVFAGPKSDRLTTAGLTLYQALGKALKLNADHLAYLFLHGIVEPAEVKSDPTSRTFALNLSRERADRVFKLMSDLKVVGGLDESETPVHEIPRKFAISYGTGVDLYTRIVPANDEWNSGRLAGRVDLVLFFKEPVDAASGPATKSQTL